MWNSAPVSVSETDGIRPWLHLQSTSSPVSQRVWHVLTAQSSKEDKWFDEEYRDHLMMCEDYLGKVNEYKQMQDALGYHSQPPLSGVMHLGKTLKIESFKSVVDSKLGNRFIFPAPQTPHEMTRFLYFMEVLMGYPCSAANRPSDTHPQFLQLDAYVLNRLLENPGAICAFSRKIPSGAMFNWTQQWNLAKEDLRPGVLVENYGIDLQGDWKNFPLPRDRNGVAVESNSIEFNGALEDSSAANVLMLNQHGASHIRDADPSIGRLCILNQW